VLDFKANCVKLVEARPLRQRYSPKNLVFGNIWVIVKLLEICTDNECVKEPRLLSTAIIWPIRLRNKMENDVRCQLVLPTNRKSHMGFQLVPKSVSSNDLERHNDSRRYLCGTIADLVDWRSYLVMTSRYHGGHWLMLYRQCGILLSGIDTICIHFAQFPEGFELQGVVGYCFDKRIVGSSP